MDGLLDARPDSVAVAILSSGLRLSPRQLEIWLRRKNVELSDSSIRRALEGKAQRKKINRDDALAELANEFVPSFFSRRQNALRRSYLRDFEARDIGALVNSHLTNALESWLVTAENPKATLADRLFYSFLVFRVVSDFIETLAPLKAEYHDDFTLTGLTRDAIAAALSEESLAAMRKVQARVLNTLKTLSVTLTVASAYGANPPNRAEDGLRFFRLRVLNSALSSQAKPPPKDETTTEEKAKARRLDISTLASFKTLVDGDFLGDMEWGYKIFRFVVLLNNSWVACQYAGKWQDSIRLGTQLLTNHSELVASSISNLMPFIKDASVWPGIAAMVLSGESNEVLDKLRRQIRDDRSFSALNIAISKLGDRFDDGLGYNETLDRMGM